MTPPQRGGGVGWVEGWEGGSVPALEAPKTPNPPPLGSLCKSLAQTKSMAFFLDPKFLA